MDEDLALLERAAARDPADLQTARRLLAARLRAGWAFGGRDLASWRLELARDADARDPRLVEAFRALGRTAVPALLDVIGGAEPAARAGALDVLGDLGAQHVRAATPALRAVLDDPDPRLRRAAIVLIVSRAGGLAAVLDVFERGMTDSDPEVRQGAATSVVRHGPPTPPLAVPALVAALRDPAAAVRRIAARQLAGVDDPRVPVDEVVRLALADDLVFASLPDGDEVLAAIGGQDTSGAFLAALDDPAPERRRRAVEVVGRWTRTPARRDEVADRLARALLHDADPGVREAAALGLERLGAAGASLGAVRPALLHALGDPDPGVRAATVQALVEAPGGADVEQRLLALLADPAGEVRSAAVRALSWLEGQGRTAADRLLELAELDPDEEVRRDAVEALGWLGLEIGHLPGLERLLRSADTRPQGAALLVRLGAAALPMASLALELVALEARPDVRCELAAALLRMGRHLDVVVPILDEVERLPAPRWSPDALDAPEVSPALDRLLDHGSPAVRSFATRALGFVPASRPLPRDLEALALDAPLRVAALEALARRGSADALARLLGALATDAEASVRLEALRALASLRLAPDQVVPALTAALDDPAPDVVDAAVRALRPLGADARPALPALERLLDTVDRRTSAIVAVTIAKLRD